MKKQLHIDASRRGIWSVTLTNPPINMLDHGTILELLGLVNEMERNSSLKVAVFQSADPDFFIAHYDGPGGDNSSVTVAGEYAPWLDFILRLGKLPVVSIAKIRGRTRGAGNELVLACDMRFASRERALFGQPEVGVGLIPGGGAMEWLPRLVGRSRAIEIVLGADDFDAETAERYGMVNRAVDDAELDATVDSLAERIASFDKQALGEAKRLINRVGVPAAIDHVASNRLFAQSLAWEGAEARRPQMKPLGYGQRSEFELSFGSALRALTCPAQTEAAMTENAPKT